jgi:hypothetical protein
MPRSPNRHLRRHCSAFPLAGLAPFDYFYSVMVLQHNPPPLINKILELIFGKLRDGGFAYFQIPVAARRRYEFNIEDYLKRSESDKATMEMHILPQRQLFGLLERSGLRVLDFQIDGYSGPAFQSVSILAQKALRPTPERAAGGEDRR